jgi:hypothetical protein
MFMMMLRSGFYYALAGVPLMGAGVFGPDVLHLPQEGKEVTFYLCLVAAILFVIVGAVKEYGVETKAPRTTGHRRRMIAIAGMLACGIGFLGFTAAYFWPANAEKTSMVSNAKPPTLFSLFMSDLRPAKGVEWDAFTDLDMTNGAIQYKIRIFYNIYDDINAHSKYMVFYIPAIHVQRTERSSQTYSIIKYMADSYHRFIDDIQKNRWAEMKNLGDASIESTKDIPFSNRIYIYHADSLSDEQRVELRKLYRKHGANVQFRGPDYALATWDSIQIGRIKPPPQYEVNNGVPTLKN